jgi:hypothetical protein
VVRLIALAFVVAACGRIGFDPIGAGGADADPGQTDANYVFITSTTVAPGALGSLAGADAVCQADADAHGIRGTFRAWLSTASTSALSRLSGARGWVRLDGRPFADQAADIIAGRIGYPIALDATKTLVPDYTMVTTGTRATGAASPANCSNWTDPSTAANDLVGFANAVLPLFTNSTFSLRCDGPLPLYCFGVDLDVPVTLPARTGRRAFVSASMFTLGGGSSLGSADTLCQSDADAHTLGGTFRALLATSTSSPASRFAETGVFVRLDGVPLAASAAAFFDGNIDAPISTAVDGSYVLAYPWTGVPVGATSLRVAGDIDTTCMDWTDPSGAVARGGTNVGAHSLAYTFANSFSCSVTTPVYCLEL